MAAGAVSRGPFWILRHQLKRSDLSRVDKGAFVVRRLLELSGLSPRVALIDRLAILELTEPPASLGGFRDLVVRRADLADMAGLRAVDGMSAGDVLGRFERGGCVFVGIIEDRIVCHAWFHEGSTPCPDHEVAWRLGAGAFWSNAVAASPEVQGAGVLARMFQSALRSIFAEHGARRVGCAVCPDNEPAIRLRQRLGFRRVGTITCAGAGLSLVRWHGSGVVRHWITRRGVRPVLAFPVGPTEGGRDSPLVPTTR